MQSSDPYGASHPRISAEGHPRNDEVASLVNEHHAVLQHLEGQVEYYKVREFLVKFNCLMLKVAYIPRK